MVARTAKRQGTARIRQAGFRKPGPGEPERLAEYLGLIAALTDEKGAAAAPELALRLGVANATVIKTLARLRDMGLVADEPGRIALTGEGWNRAEDTRRRQRTLEAFLLALGVSEDTARTDSERLLPHASEETLRAMARFLVRT